MISSRIAALTVVAIPLMFAFATDARAQLPETPGAVPVDEVASSEGAEILVTARRRAERLQDAPLAVTAVTPAQVKALNLSDTRDLVRVAPMLGFTQGSTTKLLNFVVRGVGTFVNSDGFDQSVGVAFDGVSLARPAGSIADLIDIERVEVLEGPQGMLFGRNASAGLINIISRKPELGRRTLSGRISFGSFNELKAEVAGNIPIGDVFAARLVAWESRHDGFVRNITTNENLGSKDSQGVRLRTTWEPNDKLQVNLMGEYVHADQDPTILTYRTFITNASGVRDWELGLGIVPGPENEETSSDHVLYNRSRSTALSAELRYDVGGPTLTVLGAYRNIRVEDKFDPSTTSAPTFFTEQLDEVRYKQHSIEARIESAPASRLSYVLGAIYFIFKLNDHFEQISPPAIAVAADARQTSKHYAIFGEATYPLLTGLRVIAGARYSTDRISADFSRVFLDPPPPNNPAINGPGASFGIYSTASSVKDSEWSYRFGLQADIARDVMLYGTISRGYKAAGLDISLTIRPTIFDVDQLRVRPEIARNYEVGLRSQFFDRRLTVNLTAFHEVFTDFQIATRLPVAAPVFAIQNAGELQSTGGTFSIDAHPTDSLSISGNVAYANARYTDFDAASCYPRQPTAPVGTPLTRGICVGGVQSLNEHSLQNSPKWRANLTARYETDQMFSGLNTFFQANARHQSSEVFNAVADPFERQGSYTTINLAAGVGAADGGWRLSAYATNILSEKFVARVIPGLSGSSYAQAVRYDARALFGAALEFTF